MQIMTGDYEGASSRNLIQYVAYKLLKVNCIELRNSAAKMNVDIHKITEVVSLASENGGKMDDILGEKTKLPHG